LVWTRFSCHPKPCRLLLLLLSPLMTTDRTRATSRKWSTQPSQALRSEKKKGKIQIISSRAASPDNRHLLLLITTKS
jgi:hypothetical protein